MGVSAEIRRHEGFVRDGQDSLHPTAGRLLEGVVQGLGGGHPLRLGHEVDDRNRRRGHPQGGVGSWASSLTPNPTVSSSFFAGAEMMTLRAPPFSMWTPAPAFSPLGLASVKTPVDSITIETPRSFQASLAGSFSASTFTRWPSTIRSPSETSTAPGYAPYV